MSVRQVERDLIRERKAARRRRQKAQSSARRAGRQYQGVLINEIRVKITDKIAELNANGWTDGSLRAFGILRREIMTAKVGWLYLGGCADEYHLHLDRKGHLHIQRIIDLDGVDAPQQLERCKLKKMSTQQLEHILSTLDR